MRPGFDCRLSTALAVRFSRMRRRATGSPTTRGRLAARCVRSSTCSCAPADDVRDQGVEVAIAPLRRRREPLVVRGQGLEIRNARIDRLAPLGEHRRERARVIPRDLRQMTHDVAERDEPILDVVVDLTGEIADGRAPFGLAHANRAGPQSTREIAKNARQRADLVGAGVEGDVETIEVEHGRLVGQRGQRSADPRRHPHRQQQCRGSGPAAVARNHDSTLRWSVVSGARDCIIRSLAGTTSSCAPEPERISGT